MNLDMHLERSSPLRRWMGSSLALALLVAVSACSGPAPEDADASVGQGNAVQGEGLQVSDAWIRLPPPGAAVAGAYLTIANASGSDDRLVGVDTAAAERVELHDMRMENGMMQMRELGDGLALKAGTQTTLVPGGVHMMLINPRASLAVGSSVEARLRFATAPAQTVLLEVRPLTGSAAAGPDDGHPDDAQHGDHGDPAAQDVPDADAAAHDAHAGHGDPATTPATAPAASEHAAHDKH